MKTAAIKGRLLPCLLLIAISTHAQKQNYTFDQIFKNGETSLEVAQTYASDRLVVLVMIERQQAEVGGLPNQTWSLRVTEAYRNDGSEWQLVHRHADPLVHRIALQQAATLARGGREND